MTNFSYHRSWWYKVLRSKHKQGRKVRMWRFNFKFQKWPVRQTKVCILDSYFHAHHHVLLYTDRHPKCSAAMLSSINLPVSPSCLYLIWPVQRLIINIASFLRRSPGSHPAPAPHDDGMMHPFPTMAWMPFDDDNGGDDGGNWWHIMSLNNQPIIMPLLTYLAWHSAELLLLSLIILHLNPAVFALPHYAPMTVWLYRPSVQSESVTSTWHIFNSASGQCRILLL